MNPHDYDFNSESAFELALARGVFTARNVGEWMYMGTERGMRHAFKHVDTRHYVYVELDPPPAPARKLSGWAAVNAKRKAEGKSVGWGHSVWRK